MTRPTDPRDWLGPVNYDPDTLGWLTDGVDVDPYGPALTDDTSDWFGPFEVGSLDQLDQRPNRTNRS